MKNRFAEEILELALKQCGSAEVYVDESESHLVSFEHNRLKSVETRQMRGVALRVIQEGRIGFASATDLREPQSLVDMAADSSLYGQEAKFSFPEKADEQPPVPVYDPQVADFAMRNAVQIGRACIDEALSENKHYDCGAEMRKTVSAFHLINSKGLDVSRRSTRFSISVEILLVMAEGGLLWLGEGESGRGLQTDLMKHTRVALEKHRMGTEIVEIPTGCYPVLFAPKAVGVVLEAIEVGCNGKLVQKGASPLADKLGKEIADASLTVWDDPTVEMGPVSGAEDAEGVPCSKRALVEAGVVRNFIFDLQTAGIMGRESTGNAARSFAGQPAPDYWNLVVDAGQRPMKDIIGGMKKGLIVDQMLGAGQSNVLAGEFSVNVDVGFLVEDGQIVGRVKDCMVAGNTFEVLKSLAELGGDRSWHNGCLVPAMLFDGLQVAAR